MKIDITDQGLNKLIQDVLREHIATAFNSPEMQERVNKVVDRVLNEHLSAVVKPLIRTYTQPGWHGNSSEYNSLQKKVRARVEAKVEPMLDRLIDQLPEFEQNVVDMIQRSMQARAAKITKKLQGHGV